MQDETIGTVCPVNLQMAAQPKSVFQSSHLHSVTPRSKVPVTARAGICSAKKCKRQKCFLLGKWCLRAAMTAEAR